MPTVSKITIRFRQRDRISYVLRSFQRRFFRSQGLFFQTFRSRFVVRLRRRVHLGPFFLGSFVRPSRHRFSSINNDTLSQQVSNNTFNGKTRVRVTIVSVERMATSIRRHFSVANLFHFLSSVLRRLLRAQVFIRVAIGRFLDDFSNSIRILKRAMIASTVGGAGVSNFHLSTRVNDSIFQFLSTRCARHYQDVSVLTFRRNFTRVLVPKGVHRRARFSL